MSYITWKDNDTGLWVTKNSEYGVLSQGNSPEESRRACVEATMLYLKHRRVPTSTRSHPPPPKEKPFALWIFARLALGALALLALVIWAYIDRNR